MHVVRGALKWTTRSFTTVAVLAALWTLYLWYEAILWWGDAAALAPALVWTVTTVLLFVATALVERLHAREE